MSESGSENESEDGSESQRGGGKPTRPVAHPQQLAYMSASDAWVSTLAIKHVYSGSCSGEVQSACICIV